ncbi:FAD-binding protein [Neisseriaceae bacterium JH1-16]|nr:FAD-binding protein [Neisseriaceae bacterium JH1-16]
MAADTEHSEQHWQASCDVLVIGFGAAGAAAALAAAEQGASVLVADRFGGGGASALSGGVVYLGGGTAQQHEAGFADTPAAMVDYLRHEVGDAVSADTLQRFCADSVGLGRWLESLGVEFAASVPPHKTSYPTDDYYLYYSGNETVAAYQGEAPPAPRGHRVKGAGMSGSVLFATLAAAVRRAGIGQLLQSRAERLITDDAGRVIGAEFTRLRPGTLACALHRRLAPLVFGLHGAHPALGSIARSSLSWLERRFGQPCRIEARRAVVLTTGGFIFDRERVAREAPAYRATFALGSPGCDGEALRLAEPLAAEVKHLDRMSAWRFINPPYAWVHGMLVNRMGQRFCNEEQYGAAIGHELVEKQDGRAWLILDAAQVKAALAELRHGGLWSFQSVPAWLLMRLARCKGNTLAALARRIGADPATLGDSVARYNAAASAGIDADFGKSAALLQALDTGPFYALDVSATSRLFPCPTITLGGLAVDEASGAVLDAVQRPIPGLYAAGRAAVGIASCRYVSGLSLADCLWSGRRAGRHATETHPGRTASANPLPTNIEETSNDTTS